MLSTIKKMSGKIARKVEDKIPREVTIPLWEYNYLITQAEIVDMLSSLLKVYPPDKSDPDKDYRDEDNYWYLIPKDDFMVARIRDSEYKAIIREEWKRNQVGEFLGAFCSLTRR